MKEMDERKQEGELHLLGGSTVYKQDYAPDVEIAGFEQAGLSARL